MGQKFEVYIYPLGEKGPFLGIAHPPFGPPRGVEGFGQTEEEVLRAVAEAIETYHRLATREGVPSSLAPKDIRCIEIEVDLM